MADVSFPPVETLFETRHHTRALVTVAVSLHDYAGVVVEALESVRLQTLADVDLIVVDDHSRDGGEAVVRQWLHGAGDRFGRAVLARFASNQGLAAARNHAFTVATTPYVFVLDADNALFPRCLATCLDVATTTTAAAVYTLLEVFGDERGVANTDVWDPDTLLLGNYVDAMALIARDAWLAVGGYRRMPASGWEDYDLWLKFVETGRSAIRVPQILCRYRTRGTSMLRSHTNRAEVLNTLQADIRAHHPSVRF